MILEEDSGVNIKTTEELNEILKKEQSALLHGDKGFPVRLMEQETGVFNGSLGFDRLASVSCFHEFKEQIWAYQHKHEVSGLLIEKIEMGGKTLRFPRQAGFLSLIDSDLDVLKAAKDRMVDFFADYVRNNFVYLSQDIYNSQGGHWEMETTLDFVLYFATEMEWAWLCQGNYSEDEVFCLGLGYGNPDESGDSKLRELWHFDAITSCGWNDPVKAS